MDILDFLVQKQVISSQQEEDLKAQLLSSDRKAEELILDAKILDERTLFQWKSEMLQMPLKTVSVDDVPLKALRMISEEAAKYYQMVPIALEDRKLDVGMVYPKDLKAQSALKFLSRQEHFTFTTSLIAPPTFEALMKQYRNLKGEMQMALAELEEEVDKKPDQQRQETSRVVEEAPVTKIVAVIVRNAVEGGASDIHIEPTRENLRVRFRFMGELHPSLFLPMRVHSAVVARIKILSNLKIDETRMPQDGRFSMVIDNRTVDFRVATFPTSLGEKVAIRILDPEAAVKTFEELGLEGINLEKVKNAIKKPYGLVLVTGPTGSGKTTTLYTVLKKLNQDTVNIVSLEDPVEYLLEGVNQSQVKPEIGYDFAQGLRQILRQDPDIIMVGEIRDNETAALVTHAALTGHVALSTLHTNNSFGIIPRLVDMGIQRYLIPVTVNVGMAQRLVRHLCPDCKEAAEPSSGMKEVITRQLETIPPQVKKYIHADMEHIQVYNPKGCNKCGSSGFIGRIGIFEVLEMSDKIADLVMTDPTEVKLEEEAKKEGMVTMMQDGILKVLEGVTTIEEVLRVAEE